MWSKGTEYQLNYIIFHLRLTNQYVENSYIRGKISTKLYKVFNTDTKNGPSCLPVWETDEIQNIDNII